MVDALELIASRHCTREFDSARPVPRSMIERVLAAAVHAPSSQNNQPWSVIVLAGDQRNALSDALLKVYDEDNDAVHKKPDYANRPLALPPRLQAAVTAFGQGYYRDTLGIERTDPAARRAVYRRNYEFWGAPVHMILHGPEQAVAGTYLDFGLFMQSLLLGFHALGLGAIPQFSVAAYAPTVRSALGLPDQCKIVCGLSVGWPAFTPQYAPSRMPLQDFTEWRGFE